MSIRGHFKIEDLSVDSIWWNAPNIKGMNAESDRVWIIKDFIGQSISVLRKELSYAHPLHLTMSDWARYMIPGKTHNEVLILHLARLFIQLKINNNLDQLGLVLEELG